MKKVIIIFLCVVFSSCLLPFDEGSPGGDYEESEYNPVIIDRTVIDETIAFKANEEMTKSSKIYIFNDYIFINDDKKGFHIFDNSNPSNPIKKTFLNIPGATDIAIRDNVFFINQATDLVSLTIDVETTTLKINKRIANVFPEILSPDGYLDNNDNEESMVVNWVEK